MYGISWNNFQDAILAFFSRVSQEKVGLKECLVGLDKGVSEIKTDVESHSTQLQYKGLNMPCIVRVHT